MRHVKTLAAAVFALASLPLIAQQTDSTSQQQAAPPQAPLRKRNLKRHNRNRRLQRPLPLPLLN